MNDYNPYFDYFIDRMLRTIMITNSQMTNSRNMVKIKSNSVNIPFKIIINDSSEVLYCTINYPIVHNLLYFGFFIRFIKLRHIKEY